VEERGAVTSHSGGLWAMPDPLLGCVVFKIRRVDSGLTRSFELWNPTY